VLPPEVGEVVAGAEGEVAVVFVTVVAGDIAAGDIAAGAVAAGKVATGKVATGDVSIVPMSGASDHGAITNPAHDALSKFLIRPHSLESIDKFQRAFTDIQLPRYVHKFDFSGGTQFDGSLSLFCWFTLSVTASRVRLSLVSLAYAFRVALDQAQAPESHASFNATTWSISTSVGLDHRAPS
jgi:hypothetical protein